LQSKDIKVGRLVKPTKRIDILAARERRFVDRDEAAFDAYIEGLVLDERAERNIRIEIEGYDSDDWRACAARDYERDAMASMRRVGA
jgi:hypothetical protein